ncbi:MAG: hypothetical protein ACREDR_13620, partial [Blastocatellia bacterium]
MSESNSIVPRSAEGPQQNERLRIGFYQSDLDQVLGMLIEIAAAVKSKDKDSRLQDSLRAIGEKLDAHTEAIKRLVAALKGINTLSAQTKEITRELSKELPSTVRDIVSASVNPQLEEILAEHADSQARLERLLGEILSGLGTALGFMARADHREAQTQEPLVNEPAVPTTTRRPDTPLVPPPPADESRDSQAPPQKPMAALTPDLADMLRHDIPAILALLPARISEAISAINDLRSRLPNQAGAVPKWVREKLRDAANALHAESFGTAMQKLELVLGRTRPPQASPEGILASVPSTEAGRQLNNPGRPGGASGLSRPQTGTSRGVNSPEGYRASVNQPASDTGSHRPGTG